jgi:hypothetical protein
MLIPLFFVTLFVACIIGTYHKPHPNGIKVGVVGPSVQTERLRAGSTGCDNRGSVKTQVV